MVDRETVGEASQATEEVSRDELRVVDISGSSQISDTMIQEANMLESHWIDIHGFFDRIESASSVDVTGFGDLPVPKQLPSSSATGSSSSLRLVDQFPAPSANPSRKRYCPGGCSSLLSPCWNCQLSEWLSDRGGPSRDKCCKGRLYVQ